MILAIDAGNTTEGFSGVKRLEGQNYHSLFTRKMDTVKDADAAFYLAGMERILGDVREELEGAILSSVVPTVTDALRQAAETFLGEPPVVLGTDCKLGFTSGVRSFEKVGLDRLADATWAAEKFPLPVITVDIGTATTFNVIDRDRVFRGGAIAPGVETGLRSLVGRASQLSDIPLRTPTERIGQDTESCMLLGIVAGAAALIDGLSAGFEKELGEPASLVLTGGLSALVAPLCTHPLTADPELLAKGLALLYDKNK